MTYLNSDLWQSGPVYLRFAAKLAKLKMVHLEGANEKPRNREPPLEQLVSSFITTEEGYDRNHGAIPHLDASKHFVRVDGAVQNVLDLSTDQLQNDFEQHVVICVLQCAGNRRHTMRTELKEVQGLDWGDAAVMNCRWRGPRLRDILERAVVRVDDQRQAHVAFACSAQPCQEDNWYGGSIKLDRALREDAEVILALEVGEIDMYLPSSLLPASKRMNRAEHTD